MKRKNKSKEEVAFEMHNRQELDRKREILTKNVYPALIEATVSVEEAKALIQAMGTLLMEEVLKTMKTRKFSDIASVLHGKLCPNGERSEEIARLLATLSEENLYTSRELIEGLTRAIDVMIREEMQERSLATLTPQWDKYLN